MSRDHRRTSCSIVVLAALVALACNQNEPGGASEDDAPSTGSSGDPRPLAEVGDEVITVGEFEARIQGLSPYERARYTSLEQRRELLDNMIRFEVLAAEALERGFDEDPDVVRAMKRVMIQKLMKDLLADELAPGDISEAEMRAFYDERANEFTKPEEVRASAVVLDDAAEAKRVARRAAGASPREFRDLVEAHSIDDKTRARGGDLRYFTRDSQALPQAVIEAAFAIEEPGAVAGPVDGGDGRHYILRKTGHRQAVENEFDDVKRQIQNRLYRKKRSDAQSQFLDELRGNAGIVVHEEALADVEVETGGPRQPATPRKRPERLPNSKSTAPSGAR